MAKTTKPLTDLELKRAKADTKTITLFDGNGLEYRIYKTGKKVGYFNYKHPITNKRQNIKIGEYPVIPLAEARQIRDEYRALVQKGICPKEFKNQVLDKQREMESNTLEKVAFEFWQTCTEVKEQTLLDTKRSVENHIFPKLGQVPISKLTPPCVIKVLNPLAQKGSLETVKRLCQRLNAIMKYAQNTGLIERNNLENIREMFPNPKVTNMPSIGPELLADFLHELQLSSCKRITKLLVAWQLHTITRPREASGASWHEIDFEKRIWTIPEERMKRNKEHVIPLSNSAMKILESLQQISGHRQYLFPGDRNPNSPCNSQTANAAIKRISTYKGVLCAHGLRSVASTHLNDIGWGKDIVEAALSHMDKDEVRRAYNRGTYLRKRAEMMEEWSQFVDDCANDHSMKGYEDKEVSYAHKGA